MAFERIIGLLAFAVYDRVYGPVDRMARALDKSMVLASLYEIERYISTEIVKCVEAKSGKRNLSGEDMRRCQVLEELTNGFNVPHDEIRNFLDHVERRGVEVARRLAIESLSLGLKLLVEERERPREEGGRRGGKVR